MTLVHLVFVRVRDSTLSVGHNMMEAMIWWGSFVISPPSFRGCQPITEYLSTAPDPVAEFSTPILQHMNRDHSDTTKAMVEHYVTGGAEVRFRYARIITLARLRVMSSSSFSSETFRLHSPLTSHDWVRRLSSIARAAGVGGVCGDHGGGPAGYVRLGGDERRGGEAPAAISSSCTRSQGCQNPDCGDDQHRSRCCS